MFCGGRNDEGPEEFVGLFYGIATIGRRGVDDFGIAYSSN